jgi:hypothetical protein
VTMGGQGEGREPVRCAPVVVASVGARGHSSPKGDAAPPVDGLQYFGAPGGDDSGVVVAAAGCHRGTMGMRLATKVRGRRKGGGHKKECLAPCSGPTAAAQPLLHSLSLRLGLFPGRRSG